MLLREIGNVRETSPGSADVAQEDAPGVLDLVHQRDRAGPVVVELQRDNAPQVLGVAGRTPELPVRIRSGERRAGRDDDEVEVVPVEVLESLHDKVDRSEAAARARIRRGQPGVQSVGPNENLS